MLENFASYVRNKGTEFNGILEELNNIQFYKPKGHPKYSTRLIRFALQLRYNSSQTCRLLLEQLPLPFLSLLRKLASGRVDAVKVIKMLLENGSISEDCVLIVDKMYLQKRSNISAFSILLNKYRGDHKLCIYHPAYGDQLKIFIF